MASRRGLAASNRSTSFMVNGIARILVGQRQGPQGVFRSLAGTLPGAAGSP